LITLAIALINYINLATARAMDRAKEVGIRKVVGARRGQLTAQFVVEAALMNLAALLMAVVLAASVTPLVNRLAGTQLSMATWGSALFLFFGLFAAGVLLSGPYPAFVLSSYKPVGMLKGKLTTSRAGIRKGLVVLQFSASIVLLIGTGVIYAQLDFMRRMDVGLDLEHVLVVTSPRILPENVPGAAAEHSFRDVVSKLPAVKGGSFAGNVAGHGFLVSAPARLASADESSTAELGVTGIDHHFSEVYGIDLVAGRPFEEGMPNWFFGSPDSPRPVLINEAAVRQLGLPGNEAAIDQIIAMDQIRYVVQGVLKDFNWSSAHRPVEPVLFRYNASNRYLSLRVSSADLPGTMASIRNTYESKFPGNPFEYTFADAAFAEQYRKDEQFATLFGALAGLAILIASLGLFGLASFTAVQRRKEIGVRKVLGASVRSIVGLLSREFLLLIGGALLVATPVAYFVLGRWLENFAYHIALGPGLFLLGGVVAFAIGLATVSHQAMRAALTDPVRSLRNE
ncbi:MAG: FtsX-like permease family protein, partial [Rhodothermales bacterium]